MKRRVWFGACPARSPAPVLPIAFFRSTTLSRRSSFSRAGIKVGSHTVTTEIFPDNYRFLQEHIHSQVGIVLEDNKHYLFESRLAPIVKQYGLGSINDLCAVLRTKRDITLSHDVVEAMT